MSSNTGRHHKKATDQSTNWSNWVWDGPNNRWYSGRQNANGVYEYAYRPAALQEIPRTVAGPSVVSSYVPSSSSDTSGTYYQNKDFTYQNTPQPPNSVDALSDDLAKTTIDRQSGPTIAPSTPYDTASSWVDPTTGTRNAFSNPQPVSSSSTYLSGGQGLARSLPAASYPGYENSASSSTPTAYPLSLGGPSSSYPPTTSNPYPAYTGEASSSRAPPSQPRTVTKGQRDKLDKTFKKHHSNEFKPGRIFKTVWVETLGENVSSESPTDIITIGETYGQKVHACVRRFIIIATGHGHSSCIPILTYGGRATTKTGVNANNHAIIYTGDRPPKEIRDEKPLLREPIQVEPRTPRDKLERESRVSYETTQTIEHNKKVCFVGHVKESSMRRLITDYNEVWYKMEHHGSQ